MNINKNLIIGMTLGVCMGIAMGLGVSEADGTAGTTSDPLVTVSYMELKLNALDAKYQEEISALKNQMGGTGVVSGDAQVFKIVNVAKGDAIYFADSAEFILRVGKATAIDPNNVGIPDLTDGSKVLNSKSVPTDHLMLIPSNDGRGVLITEDCWIMIKGNYTVISN